MLGKGSMGRWMDETESVCRRGGAARSAARSAAWQHSAAPGRRVLALGQATWSPAGSTLTLAIRHGGALRQTTPGYARTRPRDAADVGHWKEKIGKRYVEADRFDSTKTPVETRGAPVTPEMALPSPPSERPRSPTSNFPGSLCSAHRPAAVTRGMDPASVHLGVGPLGRAGRAIGR